MQKISFAEPVNPSICKETINKTTVESLLHMYNKKNTQFSLNDYNLILLNNIDNKLTDLFIDIYDEWNNTIILDKYSNDILNNTFYLSDLKYKTDKRNERLTEVHGQSLKK